MADTINRLDVDKISSPNYLGKRSVVQRLVGEFVHTITTIELEGEEYSQFLDETARALADVLLGNDPAYPGPIWNSAGQIDKYVAHWEGITSDDPQERVAGGLLELLHEVYGLMKTVEEQQLIKEQWQTEADAILERHVNILMGLPPQGLPVMPQAVAADPEWD